MTTLFDVALAVAESIHPAHRGVATASGSSTTLVDSVRTAKAGHFNAGTIFIRTGSSANKFARISKYNEGVFTFDNITTSNLAADKYSAVPAGVVLEDIIGCVNLGLIDIGTLMKEDVSLTVTDATEEYSLPAGVSNVCMAEITDSLTAPFDYRRSTYAREVNGKLRFEHGYYPKAVGTKIRLTYLSPHANVALASDVIDASVPKAAIVHLTISKIYGELFLVNKDKKYEKLRDQELMLSQSFMPNMAIPALQHSSPWSRL